MNRLANLFEVAAFISCASVIAGLFGSWHFLLDLASHFRIQATFALLVSGLTLYWLKRPRWSTFSLASGIACTLLLLPYFPIQQENEAPEYRLFLMNVLTNNPRKADVVSLIHDADPDFIALLETDAGWITELDRELSDKWTHSKHVARSDNFGIALFSKQPFASCEIVEFPSGMPTPTICATLDTKSGILRIIATHPLPPMNSLCFDSRNELFEALADNVANHDAERTILVGDLNCTPWSPFFKTLCRKSNLTNTMVGQGFGISWTPFGFRILGIPIDHVLVGSRITASDRRVGRLVGSDHRPVIVDFAVD